MAAAGVGVGRGVAFVVGTGVGSGVDGGLAVTSKVVEATTPASFVPTVFPGAALPFGTDAINSAARACEPMAAFGTRITILNAPRPVAVTVGNPVGDPSQVSWIRLLPGKFRPTTDTELSATPLAGDIEIDGDAALVETNGRVNAKPTRTIVIVAAQSRHVARVEVSTAGDSDTHRVPSQKDMSCLHSATRLTL